jgi:hypothetical protein
VAIPLRENVPIFSEFDRAQALEPGWKFRLDPALMSRLEKHFKLLKFLILRINLN